MVVASQQQIYQLNYPAQLSQASTKTHTFPLRIKVLSQQLRSARDLVVPPWKMIELELWRATIGLFVSSRSRSSKPARLKVVVARQTRLSAHDQQHADPPAPDGTSNSSPSPPRTELVVTSSPLLLLQVSRQLLLAAPSDLSHCSGRKPIRIEDN